MTVKKWIFVLLASFIFSAAQAREIAVFTGFGLSYGTITGPEDLADNNTGLYDTAVFDVKGGVAIMKWADVYAGGGFNFFSNRTEDGEQHYTFFPLYGGVRANVFPEWIVFPSAMAEYGAAISNRRYFNGYAYDDQPWTGAYYNFGLGVNWNITEKAVLSLNVERPAVALKDGGEIHIFKAGFAWKVVY